MIVLTSLGISLLLRKGTAEHPIAMLMAAEQRKAVMHRLSELARKELSRLLHTHAQKIEARNDTNQSWVSHEELMTELEKRYGPALIACVTNGTIASC